MTMKHLAEGVLQASGMRNDFRLAKLIDVAQMTISGWRTGKLHKCHIDVFDRINASTGIPYDRLFAW